MHSKPGADLTGCGLKWATTILLTVAFSQWGERNQTFTQGEIEFEKNSLKSLHLKNGTL